MPPDDEHDLDRDERLAEIDEWLADLEPGCDGWYISVALVRWLRDEVERQTRAAWKNSIPEESDAAASARRVREAALMEIAQAVARFDDDDASDGSYKCHWCAAMYDGAGGVPEPHAVDCPVVKARALLTSEDA